ncbi:MAG TPA: ABC transporter permease, partial [bacterium]|nr:ABC transporter permease [bacterium]
MAEKAKFFNIRRAAAVMKKEFLHIRRDSRSLVIALLAPVVLLIVYGYAVTFDIKHIDLGVTDNDRTPVSRMLIEKFSSSGYFKIFEAGRNSGAINNEAIKRDRVRMILVIPEGFSSEIKKNKAVKVQVIADGSDANTASVALGYAGIIINTFSRKITIEAARKKGFNPKKIPAVIPEPRVWYNPELKSQNFIIPGLIAVLMMLIAAMLTSLTVVREKERGTFEQLVSTPIKPLELM